MASRPSLVRTIAVGAAVGAAVLGIGGRFAMRWYAMLDYQPPYLTAGGTLNVVIIAAVAGAATGLWLWLGRRLFSAVLIQQAFFWIGLMLLTWRVLNPISMRSAMVFGPLSLVHGLALSFLTRRLQRAGHSQVVTQHSQPL